MVVYHFHTSIKKASNISAVSHEVCMESTEVKLEVTGFGAFGLIRVKGAHQVHQEESTNS